MSTSRNLTAGLLMLVAAGSPGCSCSGEAPPESEGDAGPAPVSIVEAPPAVEPPPPGEPPPRVVEAEENPLAEGAEPESAEPEGAEPEEPEPAEAVAVEEAPAEPPPEERFPLAAVAFHFAAEVSSEPAPSAPAVGYLRRGARVRVAEKAGTRGCSRGWYRIEGGGYVCHGRGVIVAEDPEPWPDAPPQPNLEAPLPYSYYTVVRDDVPEYWERPTDEMERTTSAAVRRLRAPVEPPPAAEPSSSDAGVAEEPGGDGGPSDEAPPRAVAAADEEPPDAGAADGGADRILPSFVRILLARGFIVSGGTVEGRWFRSIRGRFVERTFLTEREGPEFHGAELGAEGSLPMAFVVRGSSKALRPVQGPRLRFETAGVLRRLSALPVLGEMEREGQTYLSIGRGLLARANVLTVVEPVDRPPGVGPDEKWIDVDLSSQTLVAYEGDRPVFATVISSGREADGFGTPTGTFRIRTKHVSTTMDDTEAGAEAYSIEDVPWTMYFQDSYALHGAFWHSRFGQQRSHGCVNLSPADARWVFFWSEPALPPGWHGVRATRAHPGTVVVIRP